MEDGSCLNPRTVTSQISKLLADAGIVGHVRALRTFWATEQDRHHTSPKVTSTVMGHEKTSTFQDHYNKPGADDQRAAVGMMVKLLKP